MSASSSPPNPDLVQEDTVNDHRSDCLSRYGGCCDCGFEEIKGLLHHRATVAKILRDMESERDRFRDGMLVLLGPIDGPAVWECAHGVSVKAKCRKNCHLNPVRDAIKLLPR